MIDEKKELKTIKELATELGVSKRFCCKVLILSIKVSI
jgi:DNA-directed RNA polymerase subunit N (RpoN/RPB10)